MIKLNKTEIKFIIKYYVICKDLKSLTIDGDEVYLDEKDHQTLKAFRNLSKGY